MKEIEITKFVVRVSSETPRENADLIALDAEGNEYRLRHRVYINNEWHDAETDIICTAPSLGEEEH